MPRNTIIPAKHCVVDAVEHIATLLWCQHVAALDKQGGADNEALHLLIGLRLLLSDNIDQRVYKGSGCTAGALVLWPVLLLMLLAAVPVGQGEV